MRLRSIGRQASLKLVTMHILFIRDVLRVIVTFRDFLMNFFVLRRIQVPRDSNNLFDFLAWLSRQNGGNRRFLPGHIK